MSPKNFPDGHFSVSDRLSSIESKLDRFISFGWRLRALEVAVWGGLGAVLLFVLNVILEKTTGVV